MKKILMMSSILVIIASCGKGGSGGSQSQTEHPGTSPVEEASCSVKFYKSDSPTVIATKANQARIECKLTEEQVLSLVNRAE